MNNKMAEKLKPCPFCGFKKHEDKYIYIKCPRCGANGPKMNNGFNDEHTDFIDHENAIKAWNRRL